MSTAYVPDIASAEKRLHLIDGGYISVAHNESVKFEENLPAPPGMRKSLARLLFSEDELPQCALARYETDITDSTAILVEGKTTPFDYQVIEEVEEVLLPLVPFRFRFMATLPRIQHMYAKQMYDALARQETIQALRLISQGVRKEHTWSGITLTPDTLRRAMGMVDGTDIPVKNIVLSHSAWALISQWEHPQFKVFTKKQREKTGGVGSYYDATIYRTSLMGDQTVFVLGDPKYIGKIALRHNFIERYSVGASRIKDFYEYELGMGFFQTWGAARINFSDVSSQKNISPSTFHSISGVNSHILKVTEGNMEWVKLPPIPEV